jgi:phosphoribosylanthranilate isomerase
MTWIKICGITNKEDALRALSLGVDAVGFIFAPSPRRVDPVNVQEIVRHLPPFLLKVGVFVNQDFSEVEKIANDCHLNVLQFHGEEPPSYSQKFSLPVIKAFRIKGPESLRDIDLYPHVFILLDTYHASKVGGTGNPFPWEIALHAKEKGDFILSGGLSPENVGEAIRRVRPFGVDVNSGVEWMPGRKDPSKMVEFVKEVRKADEKTR